MEQEQGEWTVPGLPIEEVLRGLRTSALPDGATPRGVIALVLLDEPDGAGWAVRVTANIDSDEELGVLTGYVEHLRQVSAAGWDQSRSTRPSTGGGTASAIDEYVELRSPVEQSHLKPLHPCLRDVTSPAPCARDHLSLCSQNL